MLKCLLSCMLALSVAFCDPINADLEKFSENSLIPRDVLFAKPDKFCVHLSPNGKYLSYFARSESGVELVVEEIENGAIIRKFKVISARNMYAYCWADTNRHILLPEDNQGDENDHILCLNIETGEKKNLTPFGNSKSIISKISADFPNEVVISNNQRNPKYFDAYRVNIETGKCERIFENNEYSELIFNEKFQLKALIKVLDNGDVELLDSDYKLILKVPFEEANTGGFYHLKKNEDILYASGACGKDKAQFMSINLKTRDIKVIFKSEEADTRMAGNNFENSNPRVPASCNPSTFEPQFVEVNYLRSKLVSLNDDLSENLNLLRSKFGSKEFFVQGRSADDSRWLIVTSESDESVKYYLFDNVSKEIKFLFAKQPAIERYHLQKMEPIVIKSRDGLDLVCYLTRAIRSEKGKPTPLIAYIHGGPWCRDEYSLNASVQWLANRGYSVLQINYRGSSGFGKKFLNSINKNLEGVRNDIIDAIQWAIDQKIADKKKIAIMGGSFGGYSTLAGLAFTPDFFCCGVDIVGPSNFITLLSSVPEYWKPFMATWYKTAGDPDKKEDIPYLKAISPLFKKDSIKKPLLVFQGANDPRVNKAESDQIVSALKKKKHPVAYVLYPDEGHGFHREPNIKSYIALTEKFLARFLGGWCEQIGENELAGSSYEILEGHAILGVQ